MAANPPSPVSESVTIPGEVALEAIALHNGYALVLADLRPDGETDPFYGIQETVWNSLMDALGYQGNEDLGGPVWDSYEDRSRFFEEIIRSRLDGPALGAIATTKMAHDIAEVKARLAGVPH